MGSADQKRIVIVGAGFGGISAALKLAKSRTLKRRGYEIVLVDRHRHQLYTPALYEIAAIPREYASDYRLISSALIPISEIIRGRRISFLNDEFAGLDTKRRTVTLAVRGMLGYEYLVMALGSEINYFDIPGLKQYSIPLKTADDAAKLRNAIEAAVLKRSSLKILIGGAGAAGVELAAELTNFVCALKAELKPQKNCNTEFILIEAGAAILSGFNPWAVHLAEERLKHLGVAVKTKSRIINVGKEEITLAGGERLPYHILVWSGGVKGPAVLQRLGLPLSPKGTLLADRALRAEGGGGRIFAVGDNAWFVRGPKKRPLVWSVPVAEREGRHAAREIVGAVRAEKPRPFRPMRRYPFIIAVGRKYALADLVIVRFSGFLGWCVKQLVELRYLLFILPWPKALTLWRKNVRLYSSND